MSKVKKSLIWKWICLVYFHIKQRCLPPFFLLPFSCEDEGLPQSVFKSSNHIKRKYLGKLSTYFRERSLSVLHERERKLVLTELNIIRKQGILACLGCYKNITKWVAYKAQTFISLTSGDQKSKIMVPALSGKGSIPGHRLLAFVSSHDTKSQ